MPFSSAEIAASIGAFQGQSMNNMAYSQMIGMGSHSPGAMSDRIAGGAMSRVAGVGGPLMAGAMGLAGLDPMSLGMRAGMSAWGGGAGALGAGAAGLGVAGVAMGGFAAAGYAGNQVMMGAQQQSHLNSTMRSNFGFVNQQGGQGFSRGDMSQVGGMMRGMTHQGGMDSPISTMSELTNLAGNMGKMGMATGVRDVQEFSRRFREMISTLKTVAKELGTSLEEAQQFVSAQRSSGIFRSSDQTKFSSMARGTSVSGGLALSEVTGMASIGSQISRSVGGLGRQGAFGGMRAIGQVGSALQVGAISEEDIYNSTGLTGAEGRQSMASNMMSHSANFLRGGRGRYFLASMAGKNGSLDEESVQNWMNGTMDVGSTKSQANQNLGRIGRANFIRNEGRLRGAALERFGALAPTMAYSQWLSSKGHDPTTMDDRSMLAFQRFSGLGRDEADNAISMVQKLPEMLSQQRQSGRDDAYGQDVSKYRQTHGIEGMKKRVEQMRESVQGRLQQVGQDLFTGVSDQIERWFNRAMGVTEQRTSENINELWSAAKMGGSRGAEMMGKIGNKGLGGAGGPNSAGIGGLDLQSYARDQRMRTAADLGGAGGTTQEITNFSKGARGWMREAYTAEGGLASMTGESRMQGFAKLLEQRAKGGDAGAKTMLAKWQGASDTEKAGILAGAESQTGIVDQARLGTTWKQSQLGLAKGMFSTEREGDILSGRGMLGRSEGWMSKVVGGIGERLGGGLGSELMKNLRGSASGDYAIDAGAGKYLRSKEGKGLIYSALTGGEKGREGIQDKLMEMGQQKDLSNEEKGQQELLKQSLVASRFREFEDTTKNMGQGGTGAEGEKLKDYAKKVMGRDVSLDEAKAMYHRIGGGLGAIQREDYAAIARRETTENLDREKNYQKMGVGIVRGGEISLTAGVAEKLKKEVGDKGSQAAKLAMETMNTTGRLVGDPDKDADVLKEIQNKSGKLYDSISEMSIPEKTKFAKIMAGTEAGSMAGESLMREKRLKSAMRSKGQGVTGAFGGMMGLDLTKEEISGFNGKDAGSIAAFLASKKGIKDEGFQGELQKAIEAAKGGQTGKAADILNRGIAQSDEAKKKLGDQKKDPQSEIADAVKSSNKFLEALVNSNKDAKAALAQIATNTANTGNGEDKGAKPK